jgi:plasmid replication initiation protein
MDITIEKITAAFEFEKLVNAALNPEGWVTKPNQLIRAEGIVGRRDPLTELQQKILVAAISLIHTTGELDPARTKYKMEFSEFLKICDVKQENVYTYLTNEIEKMLRKGVSLYNEKNKTLIRTLWFQAIEYADKEVTFQFTERILPIVLNLDSGYTEYQLARGLKYKGKHTAAVFEIIWSWKDKGVTEYSIPRLMQQLSLEHTRYSYGQLRLRVLEPSLEEIYDWDDTIFVRFGPTFSGRRVEGVWFEVTTGEKAKQLREKEPDFKFALPEQKPVKD